MATTAAVVPNSRTPESVVIRIANDGNVDIAPFQLVRAVLLGQLLQGPLRERLRRTLDWTVFNIGAASDDFIRLTVVDGGLDATLQPPLEVTLVRFVADAMEFSLEVLLGEFPAPCDLLIELRAEHSNER